MPPSLEREGAEVYVNYEHQSFGGCPRESCQIHKLCRQRGRSGRSRRTAAAAAAVAGRLAPARTARLNVKPHTAGPVRLWFTRPPPPAVVLYIFPHSSFWWWNIGSSRSHHAPAGGGSAAEPPPKLDQVNCVVCLEPFVVDAKGCFPVVSAALARPQLWIKHL